VRALAQRVNLKYGASGIDPIILKIEHYESDQVMRYYRAADVCVVTSLHDGMNLVAKEFIASRDDERGVLILSQFTGAARELHEALIINPYHVEQGADALYRALTMPEMEQRERMRSMRTWCATSTSIAGPAACCWTRRACAGASASRPRSIPTAAVHCAG
jgi:trehalose 6-phosphate synthase